MLSARPLRPTLLPSLNALLAALALPFTLDDPTDLTPSLLLAIFESLINARLPIPPTIRQSRTRDAQSRAMLVLLGVLECDILRGGIDTHPESSFGVDDSVLAGAGGVSVDGWADEIGLGEVDPERLADGAWEETIFIGELLCWLARRKGILPRNRSSHRPSHTRSLYSTYHSYGDDGDSADLSTSLLLHPSPPSPSIPDTDYDCSALSHITDVPRHPLVHSPEPSFSASATTGTDLSIRARSVSSRTSVSSPHDDPDYLDEASHDTTQTYDPRPLMQDADDDDRPPTFRPRCIHELEDPSYIHAQSLSHEDVSQDDDPYTPPTPTPRRIHLTGWIEPVGTATERDHSAASRAHAQSRSSAGSSTGPPPHAYSRTGTLSNSTSRPKTTTTVSSRSRLSRTPRRVSPSPSPSPSSRPTATSRHPRTRTPPSPHFSPSPPPSPPSPHSDPPFDVSFSTLNNTSTPAKPRMSRQPLSQTSARTTGRTATARPPSHTPSPPSFSTPGNAGVAGTSTLARANKGARAASPPPPSRPKELTFTSRATAISPPPGSTTTVTSTLLTERARLLTELAALKRARVASGGRGASASASTGGVSAGTGSRVGRRVGVGV